MSTYVIFIRDKMNDPEEFKVYAQKASAARGDHPLKARVYYGAVETLEGLPAEGPSNSPTRPRRMPGTTARRIRRPRLTV